MPSEERKQIMEKRSSLRSWRERGGKMPGRAGLVGAGLVIMIFLAVAASSFLAMPQGNSSSSSELVKKTPVPTPMKTPVISSESIPSPSIKVNIPENISHDTPPLDFMVAGSNLDSIFISMDGGVQVAIPHDGTLAKIDFAKGYPLFIDDFSGTLKGRWKQSGTWRMEGGIYTSGGGFSGFGNPEWDDNIIEVRTRITSGKDMSVEMRWDGANNFYRVQTPDAYGNLNLFKIDSKGSSRLSGAKLSGIDPAKWHTWKIAANGSDIKIFIDETEYIRYTDADGPFLKGNSRLRATNTNAEFDYVNVYRPLSNGDHKLTIFANNTAGNSSSQTVYFTVNTTSKATETTVGKFGVPLIKNGLNITVKNVVLANLYTNIWISVRNTEDTEKQFKLGVGSFILDDNGQQYEFIKVPRTAEIAQTNLYPEAMREGAVYFEKVKEGRSVKKIVLNINGEAFEFIMDQG